MNQNSRTVTTNAIIGPTVASVPTRARKVAWGAALAALVIVAVVILALKAFENGNNTANGAAQPQVQAQPSN